MTVPIPLSRLVVAVKKMQAEFVRTTAWLFCLLWVGACGRPTYYYADTKSSGEEALAAAERRLHRASKEIAATEDKSGGDVARIEDGLALRVDPPDLRSVFPSRSAAVLRRLEDDGGSSLELIWPRQLASSSKLVAAALGVSREEILCLHKRANANANLVFVSKKLLRCGEVTILAPIERVGQFGPWFLELASFYTLGQESRFAGAVGNMTFASRVGHEWLRAAPESAGAAHRWATSVHLEAGVGSVTCWAATRTHVAMSPAEQAACCDLQGDRRFQSWRATTYRLVVASISTSVSPQYSMIKEKEWKPR